MQHPTIVGIRSRGGGGVAGSGRDQRRPGVSCGDAWRAGIVRGPGGRQRGADREAVCAHRAGLDPASYAGHSLRSGFLTSAAESGASIWKLSEVSSRWTRCAAMCGGSICSKDTRGRRSRSCWGPNRRFGEASSPTRQCHRGIVIRRGAVAPWCDAAPLIKLAGLTRSSAARYEAAHRPGIHDAAIPLPADNLAVIRRRRGSSPKYPLVLFFPGSDPRKMAARPACRISAGPYADNAAGRASWSTNPSAGGHSGDFEADNVTRGGHPQFAIIRRHPWSVG